MGYTTYFSGKFDLNKPLKKEHAEYLLMFAETRRMQRDAKMTAKRPDPVREAVGLPVGPEGAYFVGESGHAGQGRHASILDYNKPPQGQPSLWCQWIPLNDNTFYSCTACNKKRKKGDHKDRVLVDGKCPQCGWTTPEPAYTSIGWDESEKFYEYVEWIGYLIEHFLKPWGYVLNGQVSWRGEESDDRGVIHIKDNRVKALTDTIESPDPDWDEED